MARLGTLAYPRFVVTEGVRTVDRSAVPVSGLDAARGDDGGISPRSQDARSGVSACRGHGTGVLEWPRANFGSVMGQRRCGAAWIGARRVARSGRGPARARAKYSTIWRQLTRRPRVPAPTSHAWPGGRVGPVRISERVDNAVRAMAELAAADGSTAKAEVIANSQGISLKFLLDIFRDLKRGELVRSKRGPDGGFTLSRPPEDISLADIFRAVDGPLADVHDESLRDLHYDGPAAGLPEVWMAVRGSLRRVLETVTLADLVAGTLPSEVADLVDEYRRSTEERHRQRT